MTVSTLTTAEVVLIRPHSSAGRAAPGRTGRLVAGSAVVLAAAAGALLLTIGLVEQQSPPEPTAAAAGNLPSTGPARRAPSWTPHPGPDGTGHPAASPSPRRTSATHRSDEPAGSVSATPSSPTPADHTTAWSPPTRLSIPAIDVDTAVTSVGVTKAGALAVPTGNAENEAAWYRRSPSPGQYGSSVIVGHVDTVRGPSVFYRLGALQLGDKIIVRRSDHRRIVFTVDAVRRYPDRDNLPVEALYGGDPGQAGLRLITCSNFDHTIGHYRGNLVVYAHASHA